MMGYLENLHIGRLLFRGIASIDAAVRMDPAPGTDMVSSREPVTAGPGVPVFT